jgi:ribosomal protein L32
LEAGIDDNEDDRRAYQSAVRKRQAKLKPHKVCPKCKAPKTPNEACQKCGNDAELGDYLGTFLGEANPAAQRMLALLEKAGVKPTVQRVIGRLRQPVTVKAGEEDEQGPEMEGLDHLPEVPMGDEQGGNKFIMVNLDLEVRPVTAEQVEEWESMKNGTSLMPSQLDQLEKALQSGDIHFVEARASDDEGNLG